jgi:hypothetical protein
MEVLSQPSNKCTSGVNHDDSAIENILEFAHAYVNMHPSPDNEYFNCYAPIRTNILLVVYGFALFLNGFLTVLMQCLNYFLLDMEKKKSAKC